MTRQRILVVEDDPAIRTLEERMLTAAGYTVTCTENAQDALAVARAEPFDLFLLDVMMPGKSGFELARELRAEPKSRLVPILFATARADGESENEGFNLGASFYLVKPFTTTLLLTMVRAALSASAAA